MGRGRISVTTDDGKMEMLIGSAKEAGFHPLGSTQSWGTRHVQPGPLPPLQHKLDVPACLRFA